MKYIQVSFVLLFVAFIIHCWSSTGQVSANNNFFCYKDADGTYSDRSWNDYCSSTYGRFKDGCCGKAGDCFCCNNENGTYTCADDNHNSQYGQEYCYCVKISAYGYGPTSDCMKRDDQNRNQTTASLPQGDTQGIIAV